ncbi:sulfatase [Actinoplanes sp. NPDC051861]|uniref:sulfatase family protein n=1 Tax=Actinoplanes sp. NPDC051861 TaxID=3155170 RepID=UPI00341E322A
MTSRRRRTLSVVLALAALLATAACGPRSGNGSGASAAAASAAPEEAASVRPNIVFVLTDDLSENLVPYMPNVLALQREGTTFTNYTVTDSLCCPSRASILKGQFPHNTGIFKNHGSDGGFRLFHSRGEESSTFATDLQAAGYKTAFLGKYLNEYNARNPGGLGKPYTPPGWDLWVAGGNAYGNFNYALNENNVVRKYGNQPRDYLTDVISAKASEFITTSAAAGSPFMVEVSTYAPHSPYTPAPRDANSFPGLKAPRGAAFNRLPADAPPWLRNVPPLTADRQATLDVEFRKRVQAVQSVDRMLGALRATLTTAGVADRTVVIFSSDNGYHLGEYRLPSGKQTAFDTDINVPLIVAGHGVAVARTVTAPVENVDLRPTFADLAGAEPPAEADGRSIKGLLAGETPAKWRTVSLIEHRDPATDPADPDFQHDSVNIPPAYDAMRTVRYTYVKYVDGSREYYDRMNDPLQMRNLARNLSPAEIAALDRALLALTRCAGADSCLAAGQAIN